MKHALKIVRGLNLATTRVSCTGGRTKEVVCVCGGGGALSGKIWSTANLLAGADTGFTKGGGGVQVTVNY